MTILAVKVSHVGHRPKGTWYCGIDELTIRIDRKRVAEMLLKGTQITEVGSSCRQL
jgi:hypothetical protein